MAWSHEETAEEPARRGPRQVGWLSPERGQEASQPRRWPQGRPGQKPQEENRRPAKRSPPAAGEAPEEEVRAAIGSIRARFGYCAIGLGYGGIRFSARALR
jgi:hypothetical protein